MPSRNHERAPEVATVNSAGTVEALLAAGSDPREAAVAMVAAALSMGDLGAAVRGIPALGLEPMAVAEAGLVALKSVKGPLDEAVKILVAEGYSLNWIAAVAPTGRFRDVATDPELAGFLRGTLSDQPWRVAKAVEELEGCQGPDALAALIRLVDRFDADQSNEGHSTAVWAAAARPEREALDALLRLPFRTGSKGKDRPFAEHGSRLGKEGFVEKVAAHPAVRLEDLERLTDARPLQLLAIRAIGAQGTPEGLEALFRMTAEGVGDDGETYNAKAHQAAGELAARGALSVEWACAVTNSPNPAARRVGIEALGKHLADPAAVERLFEMVADQGLRGHSRDDANGALAIKLLGADPNPKTLERILAIAVGAVAEHDRLSKAADAIWTRDEGPQHDAASALFDQARAQGSLVEAAVTAVGNPSGCAFQSKEALRLLLSVTASIDNPRYKHHGKMGFAHGDNTVLADALATRSEPKAFEALLKMVPTHGKILENFLEHSALGRNPARIKALLEAGVREYANDEPALVRLAELATPEALDVADWLIDAKGWGAEEALTWPTPEGRARLLHSVLDHALADPKHRGSQAEAAFKAIADLPVPQREGFQDACIAALADPWQWKAPGVPNYGHRTRTPSYSSDYLPEAAKQAIAVLAGIDTPQAKEGLRALAERTEGGRYGSRGHYTLDELADALPLMPDRTFALAIGRLIAAKPEAPDGIRKAMRAMGSTLDDDAFMDMAKATEGPIRQAFCKAAPEKAQEVGMDRVRPQVEKLLLDPDFAVAKDALQALRVLRGVDKPDTHRHWL
jgi:hypothetical protein